ncbi:MAG: CsbD family protein [Mycobacterium sp.]
MIDINRGLAEAVMGVLEHVKGKAKEVIGTFTRRGDLVREGKAQQDKAKAQRGAARKEAEAEKARAKAKVQEARQKPEQ